ncbi:hypothetical protein ACLOJK_016911 [Asimina triloba]
MEGPTIAGCPYVHHVSGWPVLHSMAWRANKASLCARHAPARKADVRHTNSLNIYGRRTGAWLHLHVHSHEEELNALLRYAAFPSY